MANLLGKVAIITGTTADSIGRACALAMAKAGAKVVVTGRNENGGKITEKIINDEGHQAIFIKHDVTSEVNWKNVVNKCIEKYGKLDILLNNSGESRGGPIEKLNLSDLHFLLKVNVEGPFLGAKYCWKYLSNSKSGVILNMSSLTSQQPGPGGTIYGPSKATQNSLTRVMALEGAKHGIRAISVLPGLTFTDGVLDSLGNDTSKYKEPMAKRIWMGEWGKSEHIADACVFLASEEANYITGVEFNIDGGGVGQIPKN